MIFFDRSIPKSVINALKLVGVEDILSHDDVFPQNTPDPVWLARAGQQGWVVVTRDKKIRTRTGEVRTLITYGVGCFILTTNRPLTRWEHLKLFVLTLDRMKVLAETVGKPFIFTVTCDGNFRRLDLKS